MSYSLDVPTLVVDGKPPTSVECVDGGTVPISSCPGGSGKKAHVYAYLKINKDKTRIYCGKCENKYWTLTSNKGSLSTQVTHLAKTHRIFFSEKGIELFLTSLIC